MVPAFGGLFLFLGMTFVFPAIIIFQWSGTPTEDRMMTVFLVLVCFFLGGLMLLMASHPLKTEAFRYTHYPVRFNRKTRKVYWFRDDATIAVEDWDKLFVYSGAALLSTHQVRCHRLAEDGETVLDTLALPYSCEPDAPYLLSQWEFVRQYMEEGPEKLVGQVDAVQDIADRHQGFWAGFLRFLAYIAGSHTAAAIILAPLIFFFSISRWIAMRLCVIPAWPAEIEAECHFEPDDPYIRDRDNLADPATVDAPAGAIGRWHMRKRRR